MAERNWDDTDIQDGDQIPTDEWVAHINDQKGHSGRHEAGGSDETPVENLGTSGAADTVPVSQGDGSLAMTEVEQFWVEDGNSPFTTTGDGDLTANLADTYDLWRIEVTSQNSDLSGNGTFSIRLNSASLNEYTYFTADGAATENVGSISPTFAFVDSGEGVSTAFNITGRWPSNGFATVTFDQTTVGSQSIAPVTFGNVDITAPLNQISFSVPANADITLRAYGRNIE